MTPADWDPEDFAGGPQSAMKNAKGETFGFTWEAGAMILGAARFDLIERAGLGLPKTFDELIKVCDAVHNKDGVAAFTADKLHHWNWIPYLMGAGGNVFKAPPDNLTPTLDTPQAAASAEWYANLLMKYGPDGILSYSDDQADALADVGPRQHPHAGHHLDGAARQARRERGAEDRALRPDAGRARRATSPAPTATGWASRPARRRRKRRGSSSSGRCRRRPSPWSSRSTAIPASAGMSVIKSPEFKEVLTLNGQDVASLFLEVLQLGGKTGYMKYRTVPVYPQVGDKINKAIERIATKQQAAPAAMKQAQAEAIQDLQKAGIKLILDL